LGALLWQMVTHTLQPPQYVQRSLREVKIPEAVKTLIIDCLENPRKERPQRAEELLKVLQSLLFVTHEKARRKAEEEAKQAQRTAEEEAKQAQRKAEEEAKQARRKAEEEIQARRKAENELARLKAAEEKKHTDKVVGISAWRDNKQTRRQAEEAELARYYAEEEAYQRAQLQATEELKLSPFNPLDWWRLLVWTLWYPQYLKLHREIFGQVQGQNIGRRLISTLMLLPLLLPTLGLALEWLPHSSKAWNVETYWYYAGMSGMLWLLGILLEGTTDDLSETVRFLAAMGFLWTVVFLAVGVAVGVMGSGLVLAVAVGVALAVVVNVAGSVMICMVTDNDGDTRNKNEDAQIAISMAAVVSAGIMGGAAGDVMFKVATEGMLGYLGYIGSKIGGFFIAVGYVITYVAVVGRFVTDSLKTGEPSIIARTAFIALLSSNAFILFYSLLGGWRFFG